MAQPVTYNRQYNFTEYQALNPTLALPGTQVDLELNKVKATLDQTLSNLARIQRDDGALATGSVGYDQLSSAITLGITPSTAWATAQVYSVGNTVFYSLLLYRCILAHTSGTFATDLAAAKWLQIADFSALVTAGVSSLGGSAGVVTVPGGDITGGALTVVRYDVSQSLSAGQQTQAQTNIGASPTLSAGNGISIASATVTNTGVRSLGGATGVMTAGTGIAVSGQALNNDGVVTIAGNKGAFTLGAGLGNTVNALLNTGVLSIAGNTGAFTLGTGLKNSTNSLLVDPLILQNYLSGLTLSTAGSSATGTVAAGIATDSTNADFMRLAAAISKTTASWVVGTAAGGLDTGAIAINTWYHWFEIKRTDTGVVDALFSLSATAPTMPTSYTLFRRLGAMKTNGSSQWTKFIQVGDEFLWDVPVADQSGVVLGSSALYTLGSVPTGFSVMARFLSYYQSNTTSSQYVLSSGLTAAQTPNTPSANYDSNDNVAISKIDISRQNIITDTSARIRAVSNGAGAIVWGVVTHGWADTRGR